MNLNKLKIILIALACVLLFIDKVQAQSFSFDLQTSPLIFDYSTTDNFISPRTITKAFTHREIYKKQTGGRGKFADIQFEIMPMEGNTGFQFVNEVTGGNIPKEFISPVEKGFKSGLSSGIQAGYPIEGLKVRLYDGSYHDVDSDALSFELCARAGLREAAKRAGPIMLEPIMKVEVITPEDYMGDIIGDLNSRRGMILGMDNQVDGSVINAEVPLAEMFGYSTNLRSLSQGRAVYSMEFAKFAPVPDSIAKTIIEEK